MIVADTRLGWPPSEEEREARYVYHYQVIERLRKLTKEQVLQELNASARKPSHSTNDNILHSALQTEWQRRHPRLDEGWAQEFTLAHDYNPFEDRS